MLQEKDQDIIKEFFTAGMSPAAFKCAKEKKNIYLEKTDNKYKRLSYDLEKHLRYTKIESIINELNSSDAVKVEIIGGSVDKRNIYSLEIGFGNKTIMYEAGIHAAEVGPVLFILKHMIDLINRYETADKEIVELLDKIKIIVVPSLNPDGYEVCLFGYDVINNKELHIVKNHHLINFNKYKANAHGVDLNRNSPTQHAGLIYEGFELSETLSLKPSFGNYDFFPGKYLGSEPETKALIYWQYKHLRNAFAYISLHSAGREIYAGKPNLNDSYNVKSLKLANVVHQLNGYQSLGIDEECVGEGNDGTATDLASEIVCGFNFNKETGRLGADSYIKPLIKHEVKTAIITIETLEEYTFDIKLIKNEYYKFRLRAVFDALNNFDCNRYKK